MSPVQAWLDVSEKKKLVEDITFHKTDFLISEKKVHLCCFVYQGIDSCDSAGAENTLLFVADVLATLAASETGQRQLLYGEAQDRWQRSR